MEMYSRIRVAAMKPIVLAVLLGVVIGSGASAQQSDPFAPAQPLVDGWEQMDQRLVFLMVRLVDVEANLDAVDAAIAKSGGRAASARSAANRAEAGNDRMDRRAGGPVRWDKFYGTTAEKFFYHPTQNHTYHTQTILGQQSPSNDNQGESGVRSRQGVPVHQRPPQFDYMYRANENAKERATAEVAKIANKVEALAMRRAELEIEQSKLWCEIAFRLISRIDLNRQPLYRFAPKGSGNDDLLAATTFVASALSIVESGESDQASAFRQIKPTISKARKDLGDQWLRLGVKYQDESSNEWKFAALARHLEDVSSNLSDSYAVSLDSAKNSETERRDMYRGLLQKSLVQYAEAVLALNEMASELANAQAFEPDLERPITAISFGIDPTNKTTSESATENRNGSMADLLSTTETDRLFAGATANTLEEAPQASGTVSYLKNLDLRNKIEEGQWQVQRGKLVGLAAPKTARVSLGPVPFDQYELFVNFMYIMPNAHSDLILFLPGLQRSFCIRMTKEKKTVVGFFGGKELEDKRVSTTLPGAIALRTPHRLVIKVGDGAAEIFLDGKEIKTIPSFEGIEKQDGNDLKIVLSPQTNVIFDSIDVVGASIGTEVSGSPKSPLVGRWLKDGGGWVIEFLENGEARNIAPSGKVDSVGKWRSLGDGSFSVFLGDRSQWEWQVELRRNMLQAEILLDGVSKSTATFVKQ